MVKIAKDIIDEDARYGIATVQPSLSLKKCRIRNLRVEYFLSELAIFLVEPRACRLCDRSFECSDDFVFQILEKQNRRSTNSKKYDSKTTDI